MVCRFAELYDAILAHQGINLPTYDTSRLRAAAAHAGAPILDSGARLHAHPSVMVTDPDSAIEIVGYRGSHGETDTSDGVGSLTLPLSQSLPLSLSHSLSLDMLNNFCFHVYAQN